MKLKGEITVPWLKSLKPGPVAVDYWEPGRRGFSFGVRANTGGTVSFQTVFKGPGGKMVRRVVGVFPQTSLKDARLEAARIAGGGVIGEEPAGYRVDPKRGLTWGDLWDRYVAAAELDGKDIGYYRGLAKSHLLPGLRNVPLADIKRDKVWELQNALLQKAKAAGHKGTSVNRAMFVLSHVFNFGVDAGLVEYNPAAGMKKRVKETPRDHRYTDEEIRALWRAFEKEAILWSAVLKLQLYLGQRGGEVRWMEWQEIESGVWTIPGHKRKNRLEHKVPLSRQAATIVESLRPFTGSSKFVFPAVKGDGHLRGMKRVRERIRDNSGLRDWEEDDRHVNPHDLRHIVVTCLRAKPLSVSPHIVSAVVGHEDRTVARATRTYDANEYLEEKADALQAWADRLDEIIRAKKVRITQVYAERDANKAREITGKIG